jgi:hypothetical protein
MWSPANAVPSANPALSITTYLPGSVVAPVSGVSGSWTVSKPGRSAELSLSGVIVTGTTTAVVANWTSGWYRPPGGKLLTVGYSIDRLYPVDLSAEIASAQFRMRTKSESWSPWFGLTDNHQPGVVLVERSEGGGFGVVEASAGPDRAEPKLTQIQTRITNQFTATGRVTENVTLTAG